MGIKLGIATEASSNKLFLSLAVGDEHHCYFAEVKKVVNKSSLSFYLRYPDGVIGFLRKDLSCQLKVIRKESVVWVPTEIQMSALQRTLSKNLIMFSGEYQVREMTSADLLPPEEHVSVEKRYKKPQGIWETAVAQCLQMVKN